MEVKNALVNKITNILAIILGVGTALLEALNQVPEGSEWYAYLGAIVVAIGLYFTGKKKKAKNV